MGCSIAPSDASAIEDVTASIKDQPYGAEILVAGGINANLEEPEVTLQVTCSSPRRPLFLHALSFECTSKLCGTFLNQFSDYFNIKKMHNTI